MEALVNNANALNAEMNWLSTAIERRMTSYFDDNEQPFQLMELTPPDLSGSPSIYGQIVTYYGFGAVERLALAMALAPHIRPQILDVFFTRNKNYDRTFTEFGGITGGNHGGFLPTGETLSFVLSGVDLSMRFQLKMLFSAEHPFSRFNILKLEPSKADDPYLSGTLSLADDYVELFTVGHATKPNFSSKFPAKLIDTSLDWDDLVLEHNVSQQVEDIHVWVKHSQSILEQWGGSKGHVKPGYRALFYGPPGTGKTLTACLIGKSTGKDVYKIDLSMVISKWVGETEKNLARVFDTAENKDWILFFDEADALFGKRSDSGGSQERYANQEVSYLLQRTENYPGTIILASNLKGNMDEAFIRRFQSMIYFPMPSPRERQTLWQKTFNHGMNLEESIDFKSLSKEYELAGGAIVNVLKYCTIRAVEREDQIILLEDIISGVKRELSKEGKSF